MEASYLQHEGCTTSALWPLSGLGTLLPTLCDPFQAPPHPRSSSSPLPHINPIPATTFNFPACPTFQLLSLTLHKTFHTCTPISCHLTKRPVFLPTNFTLSLFSLTELLCSIYKQHSFFITLLNLLLLHLLPTPCSFHFLKLLLLHLPTTPLHCHLTKLPVGVHINYNPDLCHILSILYTQSLSDALNLPVFSTYGPLYCTASQLLLACHSSLSYLCNIPPVAPLNHWLTWTLKAEVTIFHKILVVIYQLKVCFILVELNLP